MGGADTQMAPHPSMGHPQHDGGRPGDFSGGGQSVAFDAGPPVAQQSTYNEEYERQQVAAATASGRAPPTRKVAASGGDDDQFADVELGDDLLPS